MRIFQLDDVVSKVLSLKKQKNNIIIALDGPSASGKTTLAMILAKRLDADVLHMDDFFLPPELRTEERYNTPGGNVHYERFIQEVLIPLSKNEKFVYKPFDCKTMTYKDAECKLPSEITVVEGSYSCHHVLSEFYDLKVYLDISPDAQMRRIILRNGEEKAIEFKNKWIPLENKYFEYYDIKSKCDMIIDFKGELL